jgi:hypothetical protein
MADVRRVYVVEREITTEVPWERRYLALTLLSQDDRK